jgi:hypothetical protein
MNKYKYKLFEAMATPWGQAQSITKIATGIIIVSTAGHGGLMIGKGVAKKYLSPEAIHMGMEYGSYLCYEEDVAYTIPLYDSEALLKLVNDKHVFTKEVSKGDLEKTLQDYYPKYFDAEYKAKAKRAIDSKITVKSLQVGDTFSLYSDDYTKEHGTFTLVELRNGKDVISKDSHYGRLWKLRPSQIKDIYKLERDGKVIFQKED